jgi:3-hydroxyisobutyrate dehydrogenase
MTGAPARSMHRCRAATSGRVCEALVYTSRAGLDVEGVIETISGAAGGSWSLTNYAPRMLRGDFAPGLKVDKARQAKISLPGLALAEQLYVAVQAEGRGQSGVQALVLALARFSAVEWPTEEARS